jgi:hypothetical protein
MQAPEAGLDRQLDVARQLATDRLHAYERRRGTQFLVLVMLIARDTGAAVNAPRCRTRLS